MESPFKKPFIEALAGEGRKVFILLCHARSGSNWLLSLLNSHPDVHVAAELFHGKKIFFKTHTTTETRLLDLRERDPYQFLVKEFLSQHDAKVIGFKLFYDHLLELNDKCGFINVLRSSRAKIIHLFRRNRVSTFLSLRKAQKTGIWLGQTPPCKIEWNEREYLNWERRLLWQRNRVISQLGEDRLDFRIEYEDLVKETQIVSAKLLDILGLRSVVLTSTTKKQKDPLSLPR